MSRLTSAAGHIDRSQTISFTFDGRRLTGHPGDTLASALLAHGVGLVARSFKYHRPRGIMTAGVEEPSALVSVGEGPRYEPNTRATDVMLYEGLTARSQNAWPSLAFDLGALNGLLAPFIPAGFYYKTFLGPPKLWMLYEQAIRRAAGMGAAPTAADVDAYEHRAAFCDVLVVGSGPAGLAAALAASLGGARVMLVEQEAVVGGSLLRDPDLIDGQASADWIADSLATLASRGVRILVRATACGYHDHDLVTVVERLAEPGQPPGSDGLAQRLWKVRARRVVLATGALERSMLFSGNDRPGVMLAGAVRSYIARFGVRPGQSLVLATADDDAYRTAFAFADAGGEVVAILDLRAEVDVDSDIVHRAKARFPVRFDAAPLRVGGDNHRLARVVAIVAGAHETFAADLLAVCGGFSPVAHLHMQAGGTLSWDAGSGAFSPNQARQGQSTCGAAAGIVGLGAVLNDGWNGGREALQALGPAGPDQIAPRADVPPAAPSAGGRALVAPPGVDPKTAFVDFQNDVSLGDIDLAWREGFRSVEHVKRYTTLGMATDQGKTSNLPGLARLAAAEGRSVPEIGVTTFRPPYTPVTLGALAGAAQGFEIAPLRRAALYDLHAARAPIWQPVGYWMRPRAYPMAGETLHHAAMREARAVRNAVGIIDVSTLGKFEVSGPDAAAFLELICATTVGKLAVGRGRYTVMLREDGMVADDGTVWRLAENRFLLTSSTGGADRMTAHLSYVRRVLASRLRVAVTTVQEHWAGIAVAGPQAKAMLAELIGEEPVRHMSSMRGRIAGVEVVILAASYSGERAFEVYAMSHEIAPVWTVLTEAAAHRGGCPYGLEALEFLRIEKGHIVVGGEVDGRMTPYDLGLSKMVRPAGGFVGAQALTRPALASPDRLQLVGLASDGPIPEGAMLVADTGGKAEGHVTSAGPRVLEPGAVALGFLRGGFGRLGERLTASSPTRAVQARVRVVEPVFYDPAGERYRD
jgi:sarcosine oxidase subunit alpha